MGSNQNILKFGAIAVNFAYLKVDIEVRSFNTAKKTLIPPCPLQIILLSKLEAGQENPEFFLPNQQKNGKKFCSFPGCLEMRSSLRGSRSAPSVSAPHPMVPSVLRSPPRLSWNSQYLIYILYIYICIYMCIYIFNIYK